MLCIINCLLFSCYAFLSESRTEHDLYKTHSKQIISNEMLQCGSSHLLFSVEMSYSKVNVAIDSSVD